MMNFSTAAARILTVGVLIVFAGFATAQQAYPSKPIRFISPFPPGGFTSLVARLIGQKLTESWGQPVIVDNRPGGNTIIGTDVVARAAPDGYTILSVTNAHVANQNLLLTPYHAIRDFAGVATVCSAAHILVINPSLPAKNLREVIALLKSQPGRFNYSSAGNGTSNHLAGEFFNIMAGVNVQHIPYKGGGPAIADLVGGQVQLMFSSPAAAMSLIKSGRVRAIATASKARLSALPDLPTFSEAGLPGFDTTYWYGVLAPAATPKNVINKLSTEIARIVSMPEVRTEIASQGMDPFISTPEQFAALMKADMAKFAKIIKSANIKIEN